MDGEPFFDEALRWLLTWERIWEDRLASLDEFLASRRTGRRARWRA
jgi:hypothetical protein